MAAEIDRPDHRGPSPSVILAAERRGGDPAEGVGGETVTERRTATRVPPRYAVILHNDDFTTMEFVVWVLVRVFSHPAGEAARIMLRVHQTGAARAGIYTREIAETKRDETMRLAEEHGMPLLATIEPFGEEQ